MSIKLNIESITNKQINIKIPTKINSIKFFMISQLNKHKAFIFPIVIFSKSLPYRTNSTDSEY